MASSPAEAPGLWIKMHHTGATACVFFRIGGRLVRSRQLSRDQQAAVVRRTRYPRSVSGCNRVLRRGFVASLVDLGLPLAVFFAVLINLSPITCGGVTLAVFIL